MIKKLFIIAACGLFINNVKAFDLFDRHEAAFVVGMDYNDVKASKFAPTVGLSLFPTKYLGARATTTISVDNATAFNNADAVGILRLPLWVVSPYIGGGARYSANRAEEVSAVVLAGLETRISKKWSIFVEGGHDFSGNNLNYSDWSFRGGFNLRFW